MSKLLHFSYIYLIPMLLSAIVSLRSFRLKWPLAFRIFSIFLFLTMLIECLAISWKWGFSQTKWWHYTRSNMWIYDAFVVIKYLFVVSFFYYILSSTLVKKIIVYPIWLFIPLACFNYLFFQGPFNVDTYTIIFTNAFTILCSLLFFIQVLRDKNLITLTKDARVWICLGLLLYNAGTLPFFIFFNYLINEQPSMAASYLYINDALNIIMYTTFLIAYLCPPRSQK